MQENNKKLAELLGIEPRFKMKEMAYNDKFGEWVDPQVLIELNFKIQGAKNEPLNKVYPDFTHPENFVKLYGVYAYNANNLIEALIGFISNCPPSIKIKLKHQASQIDWHW